MEITIEHTTNYEYSKPIKGLIQTTKLHPSEHDGLKIIKWKVDNYATEKSKIYQDAENNNIQNLLVKM